MMLLNSNKKAIRRLFQFMLLFGINRFSYFESTQKVVRAQIGWGDGGSEDYDADEEVQNIEWEIQHFENIEDALKIACYLSDNNLVDLDKIILSKEELFERVKWKEQKRFNEAIETLLSIKVDIIDDGRKTDHFFIHF